MLEMSEVSDILWNGGWLTWGLDTDLVILKLLMQKYNVNNYVYIHIYTQSKTQQFVRWYHYVMCNNM